MNLLFKCCFFLVISFFLPFSSYALEQENTDINPLKDFSIDYKKNIHLSESLEIDVSEIQQKLQQDIWDNTLEFKWDIKGRTSKNWFILNEKFNTPWEKEITLSIFEIDSWTPRLLASSQLNIFVYEKTLALWVSEDISQERLKKAFDLAKEKNILLVILFQSSEKDISDISIHNNISQFRKQYMWYGDYLLFWGKKEFLFSILSKINQEQESLAVKKKENFVLLSEFNIHVLEWYLSNLVADKKNIDKVVLLEESLIYQIQKHPSSIEDLIKNLKQNQFDFQEIDTKKIIAPYFFISRFINSLSSSGISTSDIYILLMIPLLLTLISFIKHFIWFSPIGISLPLFCAILCLKFWIIFFTILFLVTILINLFLSYNIGKYNLLYTPKLTFLTIINIVIFIILFNLGQQYSLVDISPWDSLYIVIYIILTEKLINIVISKEFREYKKTLYSTFLIGIFLYFILIFDSLRVFLLAYPETILLLIPINFMIGRFIWLRVTEYFRFREIIKNIEE